MSTCSEFGSHLRVHGDHDFLLLRHQGIPLLDLILHPMLEVRSDHGGADVDNPLLGHLLDVRFIREVMVNLRLRADEGKD